MIRFLQIFLLVFTLNIEANLNLSSPQLKISENNLRLIEFRISGRRINQDEINFSQYRSDEILSSEVIEYSLLKNFDNYQTLVVALSNNFEKDYFDFRIKIAKDIEKDIFIFLPARKKLQINDNKKVSKTSQNIPIFKPKIINKNLNTKPEKNNQIKPLEKKRLTKIKAEEVTTIWSAAREIQKETKASIYQIMWALYLGNENAFIDNNINLVRSDVDLIIPSNSSFTKISHKNAKDLILTMNSSFKKGFKDASKSLLVLTAPQQLKERIPPLEKIEEPKTLNLSKDIAINPEDYVNANTKIVNFNTSEPINKIVNLEKNNTPLSRSFGILDLIFVAIISIISGLIIAGIYIRINSNRIKKLEYDFEEASRAPNEISDLPADLSIENNRDEQQFDLAFAYFEMGDFVNSKRLLNKIISEGIDSEIKKKATELLNKI